MSTLYTIVCYVIMFRIVISKHFFSKCKKGKSVYERNLGPSQIQPVIFPISLACKIAVVAGNLLCHSLAGWTSTQADWWRHFQQQPSPRLVWQWCDQWCGPGWSLSYSSLMTRLGLVKYIATVCSKLWWNLQNTFYEKRLLYFIPNLQNTSQSKRG